MNNHCRKTQVNNHCGTDPLVNKQDTTCAPFSVCLPFGRVLTFNGECLTLEGTSNIADGTYGVIVVENGCIVDARPSPTFDYTPPPCTPAAAPCGSTSDNTLTLQPGACNLLTYDASSRLGAFITVEAGDGVSVTGCGTVTSPMVISTTPVEQSRTYINSGDMLINIEGSGILADPFILTHNTAAIASGTYAGFTIDDCGHITGYVDSGDGVITGIVGGPGVVVSSQGGIANISIEASKQEPGSWQLGGWDLTTDLSGRVSDVRRSITIPEGTYDGINTAFDINEYGSITGVTNMVRTVSTQFASFFDGERDTTIMEFTTDTQGFFRVIYRGNLGLYTGSSGDDTLTKGLLPLPKPYRVLINGQSLPAYIKLENKYITEVHLMTFAPYIPGSHKVELAGPSPTEDDPSVFKDISFMDVSLVGIG